MIRPERSRVRPKKASVNAARQGRIDSRERQGKAEAEGSMTAYQFIVARRQLVARLTDLPARPFAWLYLTLEPIS
jgi:hypothetical protein